MLPRLVRLGDPALWLHFVEEAALFEEQLAPLRGLPLASEEDSYQYPSLWSPGGSLQVCFRLEIITPLWKAVCASEEPEFVPCISTMQVEESESPGSKFSQFKMDLKSYQVSCDSIYGAAIGPSPCRLFGIEYYQLPRELRWCPVVEREARDF